MNNPDKYTVIVIGAGHAGCEAALASARMGAKTLLVSTDKKCIAKMSCNPSIGGIGKSHLVNEIDALGGEIARNADYSGIQFRILNLRKGPAVQSIRIQCDKAMYSLRMTEVIANCKNIIILESSVIRLWIENGKLKGIITKDNNKIEGKTVILALGTFLNGVIYIGSKSFAGGRKDETAVSGLSDDLKQLGFNIRRFKTGTPPRIHKDSINYNIMNLQSGNEPPSLISYAGNIDYESWSKTNISLNIDILKVLFHVEQLYQIMRPWIPGTSQIPCYLTHTTDKTHEIVTNNLHLSSLYGGYISGTGVRYCPSIEDKIVKFPANRNHHVFIEPEGRNSLEVYPNGISNSLPEHIQEKLVYSIPGLENCKILQYGYGIEYDYSDPTQLTDTLESKQIANLFFAGQINGTTGYEEAAAQGFVAGVNAARKAMGRSNIRISRHEGYIGVLIDDLVTKGTDEPYRMFTSRAEHRLMMRQDNAIFRMLELAKEIGICGKKEIETREKYLKMINDEIKRLDSVFMDSVSLSQMLKNPKNNYEQITGCRPDLPDEVKKQIEIQLKYDGYIKRELEQIKKYSQVDAALIPAWIDYDTIKTLRFESRQKLQKIRPGTLGQASRIPGVNPSDIAIIDIWVKRGERKQRARAKH
ncbi:MAG: FAD-dependent oxidoreductase [Kiritimatiellia bacterium]|nr:FAD-dependent oxidoreductase [Kiritimatiellia bacterium]